MDWQKGGRQPLSPGWQPATCNITEFWTLNAAILMQFYIRLELNATGCRLDTIVAYLHDIMAVTDFKADGKTNFFDYDK
jgi:hypothetical protein